MQIQNKNCSFVDNLIKYRTDFKLHSLSGFNLYLFIFSHIGDARSLLLSQNLENISIYDVDVKSIEQSPALVTGQRYTLIKYIVILFSLVAMLLYLGVSGKRKREGKDGEEEK